MNTVEIPERGIFAEYPSCWEELTDAQFAFVMQSWLKVEDGKLNIYEFLLLVLYHFLGITRSPLDQWKDARLAKSEIEQKFANIWQLSETLHWLYREEETPEGMEAILNYNEIRNRIPELRNDAGTLLIGPAFGLTDITFGEYRAAWSSFEAFGTGRQHDDLDRFIAVLYRPERADYHRLKMQPGFDGVRREAFNRHLIEHYATLLKNVPFWEKQTIWLWFFNCDRFLKEEEILLGGKVVTFAELFSRRRRNEDAETLDENDLGMLSLLFMLAESGLFGSIENVERTNFLDVLTALLYWKQQADRIKLKK